MNQEYKAVGKEIKRIIADDIVTGKAVFTDDLRLTGMVYAWPVGGRNGLWQGAQKPLPPCAYYQD